MNTRKKKNTNSRGLFYIGLSLFICVNHIKIKQLKPILYRIISFQLWKLYLKNRSITRKLLLRREKHTIIKGSDCSLIAKDKKNTNVVSKMYLQQKNKNNIGSWHLSFTNSSSKSCWFDKLPNCHLLFIHKAIAIFFPSWYLVTRHLADGMPSWIISFVILKCGF